MNTGDSLSMPLYDAVSRPPSYHDGSESYGLSNGILLTDENAAFAKEQLNARLPIARLEPEILCLIFSMLRNDAMDHERSMTWTAFTQVSRMWRSISLGYAPLWNVLYLIPRTSNVELSAMLSRSKASPLTVKIHGSGLWEYDILKAIESFNHIVEHHSDRLEGLEIYTSRITAFLEVLASSYTFAILKSVQCVNTGNPIELDLFRVLTPSRFPRLSTLDLKHIALRCSTAQLHNARSCFEHLNILRLSDARSMAFHDGPGILDLLEILPALQLLRLNGACLSLTDIYRDSVGAIKFPPNLRDIVFGCGDLHLSDQFITFFRKLEDADTSTSFTVAATNALPFFTEFFGVSRKPRLLDILIPYSQVASISADRPCADPHLHAVNALEVIFDDFIHLSLENSDSNLVKLCSNICREEIVTLKLMTSSSVATGRYRRVFESVWKTLHSPKTAVILACGKAAIYSLLDALTDHGRGARRYLHMQTLSFSREETEAGMTYQLPQWAVEYLLTYARERKAKGIPIGTLTLWRGAVSEAKVHQLQNLVTCVEFDDRYYSYQA